MEDLGNKINMLDKKISDTLNNYVLKPSFAKGALHLLLILYAAHIAPMPPKPVLDLFDNGFFKLFVFSMILWSAQFSPSTSILISLAFLVTMNYATTGKLWEHMENTQASSDSSSLNAPSKDLAMTAASSKVEGQMQMSPTVTTMVQDSKTTIITPSVVDGKLVNPTVVVAPAVVQKDGQVIVVKPDVSTMDVKSGASATPSATATQDASATDKTQTEPPKTQETQDEKETCYSSRKFDLSNLKSFNEFEMDLKPYTEDANDGDTTVAEQWQKEHSAQSSDSAPVPVNN